MRRSKLGWAAKVVAPWCVASGLVVSFTAQAEQEPFLNDTMAAMNAPPLATPRDLVPSLPTHFGFASLPRGDLARTASLVVGDPEDLSKVSNDYAPRMVMKPDAGKPPESNDGERGDPAIGLRPTFESQLQNAKDLQRFKGAQMLSGEDYLAFDGFDRGAPRSQTSFATDPQETADDSTTGEAGGSGASGSAPSLRSGSASPQTFDGATPSIGTAQALASTTPAPADATPVEVVVGAGDPDDVAALPPAQETPEATVAPIPNAEASTAQRSERPDYASLIDQDHAGSELRCLAEAIYFEARGEPDAGQAAVAQVVLNRVASGLYPSTVCGVVFQNRWRRNACQFSFACDGHSLRISEADSWARAMKIAAAVSKGSTYIAAVGDATHYHANYVRPRWANRLKRTDRIGHHIFYALKPGQT